MYNNEMKNMIGPKLLIVYKLFIVIGLMLINYQNELVFEKQLWC